MSDFKCGMVGITLPRIPSNVVGHESIAWSVMKAIEIKEIRNEGNLYGNSQDIQSQDIDYRGSGEIATYELNVQYDGDAVKGQVYNKRTCELLFEAEVDSVKIEGLYNNTTVSEISTVLYSTLTNKFGRRTTFGTLTERLEVELSEKIGGAYDCSKEPFYHPEAPGSAQLSHELFVEGESIGAYFAGEVVEVKLHVLECDDVPLFGLELEVSLQEAPEGTVLECGELRGRSVFMRTEAKGMARIFVHTPESCGGQSIVFSVRRPSRCGGFLIDYEVQIPKIEEWEFHFNSRQVSGYFGAALTGEGAFRLVALDEPLPSVTEWVNNVASKIKVENKHRGGFLDKIRGLFVDSSVETQRKNLSYFGSQQLLGMGKIRLRGEILRSAGETWISDLVVPEELDFVVFGVKVADQPEQLVAASIMMQKDWIRPSSLRSLRDRIEDSRASVSFPNIIGPEAVLTFNVHRVDDEGREEITPANAFEVMAFSIGLGYLPVSCLSPETGALTRTISLRDGVRESQSLPPILTSTLEINRV